MCQENEIVESGQGVFLAGVPRPLDELHDADGANRNRARARRAPIAAEVLPFPDPLWTISRPLESIVFEATSASWTAFRAGHLGAVAKVLPTRLRRLRLVSVRQALSPSPFHSDRHGTGFSTRSDVSTRCGASALVPKPLCAFRADGVGISRKAAPGRGRCVPESAIKRALRPGASQPTRMH